MGRYIDMGYKAIRVTMGAALLLYSWVPNFGIQKSMRHTDETNALLPPGYHFADGYLHPDDAPGYGVDIDEASQRNVLTDPPRYQ